MQKLATVLTSSVLLAGTCFGQDVPSIYGDHLSRTLNPPAPKMPGLPDLNRSVFIRRGAFVCKSPVALDAAESQARLYPDKLDQSMRALSCVGVTTDTLVNVIVPRTVDNEWRTQAVAGYAVVSWLNSDGSSGFGYAKKSWLRN
jgi:hypothetical protein